MAGSAHTTAEHALPGPRSRFSLAVASGLLVVCLASAGPGGADADSPGAGVSASAAAGKLDRALARSVRNARAPGATAAVIEGGRVVWTGAAGRARGGRGARMQAASLFPIASTTKTVTATLAMGLAEEGSLRLDRPVSVALPSLPGSDRITPRQLLNHSGGLNEYFNDGAIDRLARRKPYRRWTRGQVLKHVKRLRFRPGSRHSYSNSGYVALGGVIEHASGEGLDEVFQRIVAIPLGLEGATYRYGAAPQRRFAHPLRRRRGGGFRDRFGARARVPTDYWGETWTDGGLATTAEGLARIGNALYAGNLLQPASVAAMLPPRRGGYGLGSFDQRYLGRTWVGHDGSYGGYQTENWTDRARGITVVVMTNSAGGGSVSPRLWRDMAAAYTG